MVRDTLLGFPSHSLPYRYRQSYHFIDSLTAERQGCRSAVSVSAHSIPAAPPPAAKIAEN